MEASRGPISIFGPTFELEDRSEDQVEGLTYQGIRPLKGAPYQGIRPLKETPSQGIRPLKP